MPAANAFGSYAGRLVNAEHLAVARIEDDRGAVEAERVEAVLDRLLHVVVDRQLQPLALDRRALRSSVRISRPTLLTTTRLAPSSPISSVL